ncbi:MAG: type I-E CRISPR-associated protein Cas5/CasD [Myxococcales bacterium]|nr:type I-E CRISPR-associated protein Cas5/CasD [Myxococcales bacterium]
MSVLLLRLEGPLQAWSAQGKLGVRDTEREPTKSGVLGMLGAALGMPRDDDATLATLAALTMAVRVDRAGSLLRDYHTAGGGQFRGGKYSVFDTKDCVPTTRFYLQDAIFTAALEGEASLVARLADALHAPRYPLFLGRRACPPSAPPFLGVVEATARDAVRTACLHERRDPGALRLVIESNGAAGDPRYDVPLSFAQSERRYGRRYVITEWHTPESPREEAQPS